MKKLKHPNLVRLYDEGITDAGNYYLISEYLPKGNLSDYCYYTQSDVVELFQSSKSNISEHIKHIFEEGELNNIQLDFTSHACCRNGLYD